jgi:hypothetical protein
MVQAQGRLSSDLSHLGVIARHKQHAWPKQSNSIIKAVNGTIKEIVAMIK